MQDEQLDKTRDSIPVEHFEKYFNKFYDLLSHSYNHHLTFIENVSNSQSNHNLFQKKLQIEFFDALMKMN